jgi:hypothetical protein
MIRPSETEISQAESPKAENVMEGRLVQTSHQEQSFQQLLPVGWGGVWMPGAGMFYLWGQQ